MPKKEEENDEHKKNIEQANSHQKFN